MAQQLARACTVHAVAHPGSVCIVRFTLARVRSAELEYPKYPRGLLGGIRVFVRAVLVDERQRSAECVHCKQRVACTRIPPGILRSAEVQTFQWGFKIYPTRAWYPSRHGITPRDHAGRAREIRCEALLGATYLGSGTLGRVCIAG